MKTNRMTALAGILLFGMIFKTSAQTAWDTNGNFLTLPNSNFLGTTSNTDLVFKRNGVFSGAISANNTSFGSGALLSLSLGTANTAIGTNALYGVNKGSSNVAVGYESMKSNSGGNNNIGIGWRALGTLGGASNNVAIGLQSLYSTNGNHNTAIGHLSGYLNTGSANIFIGREAGYNELGSNKLYISNSNTSNPMIYGEFDNRKLVFNVDASASSRVEIKSAAPATSGLRFANLNSTATATANTTGKFLTVGTSGDVVLESLAAGLGNNLYNSNGSLTSNRTVSMADKTLVFDTDTNGRIYVGDNSPTFPTTSGNYRLYVEGGILAEKVKIALPSSANWADYVFADDYQLMSLPEVEAYVKIHKHLPKVASSEELVKSGLDISAMQASQMEKIEELTLHLIEQNKKLESQGKEIQALREQMKVLLDSK